MNQLSKTLSKRFVTLEVRGDQAHLYESLKIEAEKDQKRARKAQQMSAYVQKKQEGVLKDMSKALDLTENELDQCHRVIAKLEGQVDILNRQVQGKDREVEEQKRSIQALMGSLQAAERKLKEAKEEVYESIASRIQANDYRQWTPEDEKKVESDESKAETNNMRQTLKEFEHQLAVARSKAIEAGKEHAREKQQMQERLASLAIQLQTRSHFREYLEVKKERLFLADEVDRLKRQLATRKPCVITGRSSGRSAAASSFARRTYSMGSIRLLDRPLIDSNK